MKQSKREREHSQIIIIITIKAPGQTYIKALCLFKRVVGHIENADGGALEQPAKIVRRLETILRNLQVGQRHEGADVFDFRDHVVGDVELVQFDESVKIFDLSQAVLLEVPVAV